jgi:hypothetical protein
MNAVDRAFQNQLANIQVRTGKTLDELYALIRASDLTRHGEIREMAKSTLGMGHGDANTLARFYLAQAAAPQAAAPQAAPPAAGAAPAAGDPPPTASAGAEPEVDVDLLDALYAGAKAPLRQIHEAVMAQFATLGPFELAPKKGYLSLRQKRQFAMLGPGTRGRVELGLNMKGIEGTERLIAQPPGGMCQYKVFLTSPAEVDAELAGWLRAAYDAAG